jgi:hypothetical protein
VLDNDLLLFASPPALQKLKFLGGYFGYGQWAGTIREAAKGNPVIFLDGFQQPSYYNYYNNTLRGFDYNSFYYRKTQFDIWPLEDSLQHKKVLYVLDHPHADVQDQVIIPTNKGNFYGKIIGQAMLYQKLHFTPLYLHENWEKGEKTRLTFLVQNPYDHAIDFSAKRPQEAIELISGFYKNGQVVKITTDSTYDKNTLIPAKGHTRMSIMVEAPDQPGNYKLFIALKTKPFPGSRNSDMININVK